MKTIWEYVLNNVEREEAGLGGGGDRGGGGCAVVLELGLGATSRQILSQRYNCFCQRETTESVD